MNGIKNGLIKKVLDKTHCVEFACMIILILQALFQAPYVPPYWNSIILTFSYKYGFIQRGFLGSVIAVLSKILPFGPGQVLRMFQYGTNVIFFITIVVIAFWSIRKWKDNRLFLIISLLFIMGFGFSTWFSSTLFGHSDIWLIVLSIVALYAIWNDIYEVAVVISVICVLIHQVYFFMYFNVLLLAFALKFVITEQKRKRIFMNFTIMIISCVFLFAYLQFFAQVNPGIDYDTVRNHSIELTGRSDIDNPEFEAAVKNYLFHEESPYPFTYGIQKRGKYALIEVLFMLPFWVELAVYWRKIILHTEDKMKKGLYLLIPFGIITMIPCFVMHCDYGRWFYAVYFYEVVAIWLVNIVGDEGVKISNREMISRIRKNIVYYLALSIYWGWLGGLEKNMVRSFWKELNAIIVGMIK